MNDEYRINKKTGILVYTSTESVISEEEKRLIALANGATPIDENEKTMQAQIKEIEGRGHIVEIPSM